MTPLVNEHNKSAVSQLLVLFLLIIILGVGGYYLLKNKSDNSATVNTNDQSTNLNSNENKSIQVVNTYSENTNSESIQSTVNENSITINTNTETSAPELLTNIAMEENVEWMELDVPDFSISFQYPDSFWQSDDLHTDPSQLSIYHVSMFSEQDCYINMGKNGILPNECIQISLSIFKEGDHSLPTEVKSSGPDTFYRSLGTSYSETLGAYGFNHQHMSENHPKDDRPYSIQIIYNQSVIKNPIDDQPYTYEIKITNGMGGDMLNAMWMNKEVKIIFNKIKETISLSENY